MKGERVEGAWRMGEVEELEVGGEFCSLVQIFLKKLMDCEKLEHNSGKRKNFQYYRFCEIL